MQHMAPALPAPYAARIRTAGLCALTTRCSTLRPRSRRRTPRSRLRPWPPMAVGTGVASHGFSTPTHERRYIAGGQRLRGGRAREGGGDGVCPRQHAALRKRVRRAAACACCDPRCGARRGRNKIPVPERPPPNFPPLPPAPPPPPLRARRQHEPGDGGLRRAARGVCGSNSAQAAARARLPWVRPGLQKALSTVLQGVCALDAVARAASAICARASVPEHLCPSTRRGLSAGAACSLPRPRVSRQASSPTRATRTWTRTPRNSLVRSTRYGTARAHAPTTAFVCAVAHVCVPELAAPVCAHQAHAKPIHAQDCTRAGAPAYCYGVTRKTMVKNGWGQSDSASSTAHIFGA